MQVCHLDLWRLDRWRLYRWGKNSDFDAYGFSWRFRSQAFFNANSNNARKTAFVTAMIVNETRLSKITTNTSGNIRKQNRTTDTGRAAARGLKNTFPIVLRFPERQPSSMCTPVDGATVLSNLIFIFNAI